MATNRPLLFAIREYIPMAAGLASAGGFEPGQVEVRVFPDGELYQRVRDEVAGRDVMVLGGTVSESATLELFDLAYGLVCQGARQLLLLLPYFGYSTSEKISDPGKVVKAKARALLLSSLPRTPHGNRVLLFDVHSQGIPLYFENGTAARSVDSKPVMRTLIEKLNLASPMLCSPDIGRIKWMESLAGEMGLPFSAVLKKRISGERTEIIGFNLRVGGRNVILCDDMIRTGETLSNAAALLKREGAASVHAVATHGVFAPGALDRLKAAGTLDGLVCTDSHPRSVQEQGDSFLRCESAVPVLAREARREII